MAPELAFIALGSNIEPERHLRLAFQRLSALGRVIGVSTVYQNPAIAAKPQPDYLNAAVLIETTLAPLEIRAALRAIEESLERVRTSDKNAPRTIDLDLCLWGKLEMDHATMSLPDPDVLIRPHLAVTLAELQPDYVYPGSHRSLKSIADEIGQGANLRPRSDVQLSLAGIFKSGEADES